jgi:hypothetical protein
MTPSACIAYNAGYRGTETGPITFPNSSTCWVAMDENTSGSNPGLSNFTRVPNEHYLVDCIDATQPAMVADSQLLMKVVTAGGAITAVTDLRTAKAISTTGTVTSITATAPVVVTPSPLIATGVVSLGTVPPANGGTGAVSPTARNVAVAEGASTFNFIAMPVDTFLQGQGASADPTAGAIPACAGDGIHALTYTSHALACSVISSSAAAHGMQYSIAATDTFTVPANVYSVIFEVWAPGGGGGGYGATPTDGAVGAGHTTVVQVSGTVTIADALPGGGGKQATATGVGKGGAAGTCATGTLKLSGLPGFYGNVQAGSATIGGTGGAAPRGGTGNDNQGSGGAGGGDGAGVYGGGGGASGGYCAAQVTTTPSATFTVTNPAGGAAGTGATQNGVSGVHGATLATW